MAHHKGLVFNPGERVEGFSNLLWTLYLSAAGRIGLNIVGVAVVTSIFASTLALLLAFLILNMIADAFHKGEGAASKHLFFVFTLACSTFFPFVFYASSGMETGAYLLFLLLGVYLHVSGVLRREKSPILASLFSFLTASLIRPEGVLFLILSTFFSIRSLRPFSARKIAAIISPLILYSSVSALKASYFGGLIPNTFYAKPGASIHYTRPIAEGFFYLVRFSIKSGFLLLLPFALFPPGGGKKAHVWFYLWSFILVQLLFIVYVGADVLRFDRFTVPFFAFYFCLAFAGAESLLSSNGKISGKLVSRAVLSGLIILMAFNIFKAGLTKSKRCIHYWMQGGTLKHVGLLMKESLAPGSTVAANEIGAIAYYSKLHVIDMLGLTDRTISKIRYESLTKYGYDTRPECEEKLANYILDRSPDCIILPSYKLLPADESISPEGIMHPLWLALFGNESFKRGYHRVLSIKINEGKFENVYVRDGVVFKPKSSSLQARDEPCAKIVWKQSKGNAIY